MWEDLLSWSAGPGGVPWLLGPPHCLFPTGPGAPPVAFCASHVGTGQTWNQVRGTRELWTTCRCQGGNGGPCWWPELLGEAEVVALTYHPERQRAKVTKLCTTELRKESQRLKHCVEETKTRVHERTSDELLRPLCFVCILFFKVDGGCLSGEARRPFFVFLFLCEE